MLVGLSPFLNYHFVEDFFDSLIHNTSLVQSQTAFMLVIAINPYYSKLYSNVMNRIQFDDAC
jgi:hypothetical protein